jgi:hypothetical protein
MNWSKQPVDQLSKQTCLPQHLNAFVALGTNGHKSAVQLTSLGAFSLIRAPAYQMPWKNKHQRCSEFVRCAATDSMQKITNSAITTWRICIIFSPGACTQRVLIISRSFFLVCHLSDQTNKTGTCSPGAAGCFLHGSCFARGECKLDCN